MLDIRVRLLLLLLLNCSIRYDTTFCDESRPMCYGKLRICGIDKWLFENVPNNLEFPTKASRIYDIDLSDALCSDVSAT